MARQMMVRGGATLVCLLTIRLSPFATFAGSNIAAPCCVPFNINGLLVSDRQWVASLRAGFTD